MKNRAPSRVPGRSPLAWLPVLFALAPLGVMIWAIPLTSGPAI